MTNTYNTKLKVLRKQNLQHMFMKMFIHRNGYSNIDEWEFMSGDRVNKPTYPDGAAPTIPHPKFKDIISSDIEPLYTPIPFGMFQIFVSFCCFICGYI